MKWITQLRRARENRNKLASLSPLRRLLKFLSEFEPRMASSGETGVFLVGDSGRWVTVSKASSAIFRPILHAWTPFPTIREEETEDEVPPPV